MKRIILLCVVALSVLSVEAQTKKSKKSKKPSKEAIANAKFTKLQAEKKLMRDSVMVNMKMETSLRLAGDSMLDLQKYNMSLVYRQEGLKNIDSLNKLKYAAISRTRDESDITDKTQMDINKAAKLSEYQSKQVKFINQMYTGKANALIAGVDPLTKKQELAVLNEERRAKIKVVVGKSRERKLESERKDYFKKNTADQTNSWINIAESVASN